MFIGVDAEWKTSLPVSNKRNRSQENTNDNQETEIQNENEDIFVSGGSEGGASILQVKYFMLLLIIFIQTILF